MGSTSLPYLGSADQLMQRVHSSELSLVRGKTPEFTFMAETGAMWDQSKCVFYASAVFSAKASGNKATPVPNMATNPGIALEGKFNDFSFLKNDLTILSNRVLDAEEGAVDIAVRIHLSDRPPMVENLVLILISQRELRGLLSSTGSSQQQSHPRFLFLHELANSPRNSTTGTTYRKFELKVKCLAARV